MAFGKGKNKKKNSEEINEVVLDNVQLEDGKETVELDTEIEETTTEEPKVEKEVKEKEVKKVTNSVASVENLQDFLF